MREPTLVIMAAGMGSRYGGLKQIDPVTPRGEIILDFSLYDARQAGFKKAVFVIREDMKEAFQQDIDGKAGKYLDTAYAFQKLTDLPAGYAAPEHREKPWGTAHAILCCKPLLDGPFAVVNADDYYGAGSFRQVYEFLSAGGEGHAYCMAGYRLENTITENGHVARGICELSPDGRLAKVVERTKIKRHDGAIAFTGEDETTWTNLDPAATVSMNFWGFTNAILGEIEAGFRGFLDRALKEDPLKGEYLLPFVVDQLIQEGKATVQVLKSHDKWYGVTYKEDKAGVMEALQSMKEKGQYPEKLWE